MTDIDLSEVNIHVVAVVPEKIRTTNNRRTFEDEEEENE